MYHLTTKERLSPSPHRGGLEHKANCLAQGARRDLVDCSDYTWCFMACLTVFALVPCAACRSRTSQGLCSTMQSIKNLFFSEMPRPQSTSIVLRHRAGIPLNA